MTFYQSQWQSEDGGLELPWGHFRGGAYPLHHGGQDLAHHPLHLSHAGPRGGGGRRVERRAGGLHMQHRAARVQERLLRPRLPDLPHPLLGAAGHIRIFSLAGLHGPRSLQAAGAGEGPAEEEGSAAEGAGVGRYRVYRGEEEDRTGDEAA